MRLFRTSYYISSELKRLIEHANAEPKLAARVIESFKVPVRNTEGALDHFSRALLDEWRQHGWLHNQFWHSGLRWSLVKLEPSEIDVMPLGGKAEEFHYPKLDRFVAELRDAANQGKRIPGVNDDPVCLLNTKGRANAKAHNRDQWSVQWSAFRFCDWGWRTPSRESDRYGRDPPLEAYSGHA